MSKIAFETKKIPKGSDLNNPPAKLTSQGLVAWVRTIECSVNIRNLPVTEWLKCIFRTRFITRGLLEEDGEIWDEGGALVAISRQIAQYRSHHK